MRGPVVKVAVSSATYSLDKPYDYLIPAHFADIVRPGMRVIVPFGRGNRRCEGLVLSVAEESAYTNLKPIDNVVDDAPVLTEGQIKLALWMRERFFCTVYDAVRAMLPTGLWYQIRYRYRLADGLNRPTAAAAVEHASAAMEVLDDLLAAKGPVEKSELEKRLGAKTAEAGICRLLEAEVIVQTVNETRRVKDKHEKFVRLVIGSEDALELARRKRRSAKKQAEVLEILSSAGEISAKELAYYTGAAAQTLNAMARAGLITIEAREVLRRPAHTPKPGAVDTTLTEQQQTA